MEQNEVLVPINYLHVRVSASWKQLKQETHEKRKPPPEMIMPLSSNHFFILNREHFWSIRSRLGVTDVSTTNYARVT